MQQVVTQTIEIAFPISIYSETNSKSNVLSTMAMVFYTKWALPRT